MRSTHTFAEWRELVSVLFELRDLCPERRYLAKSRWVKHDRVVFARVRFSPTLFSHHPARMKGMDNNYLLYEQYFSGAGKGVANECSSRVDTNILHLVDMSREYITMTTDSAVHGVVIPHDAVGYDPSRHPCYRNISATSAAGQMLQLGHRALLDAIERSAPDMDTLYAAFLSLIRILLLNHIDDIPPEDAAAQNQALIERHITENLHDTHLTVDSLVARFGVSRSSLYRMFQADGGVLKYISDRRLDRCVSELAAQPAERGRVRQVAERWGYFEPASFNRRFRERFGVRPSDCLGASTQVTESMKTATHAPLHNWMRAL